MGMPNKYEEKTLKKSTAISPRAMIHTQTARLIILNKWTIVYAEVYALSYEDPYIAEGPSLELAEEKVKP